ncbi:MAG: Rrf2 family transcriptional regulator [Verrucomicrobia bacterium]|nr:Rrf2 family transcriptional regulator [Verrucomicrobiota bacterium]
MTGNSRFAVSVHILAYLAFRQGSAVPSAEIASSVDTNPVVIRRLLSALVKTRLVNAQKGATGGFSLAVPASDITLLHIYRAVEPQPAHGMNRFAPNHKCPVGAKIESILHGVFVKAQAGMEHELSQVTLAQVHEQLHSVCPGKKK